MFENERSSVNSYSRPEKVKEIFCVTVWAKKLLERYKHKQVLHGIRAEIYRSFIKISSTAFRKIAEPILVEQISESFNLSESAVEQQIGKALDQAEEEYNEEHSPDKVIEEACKNRSDIEERTRSDLEEVEIELPDKGDREWFYH